MGPWGPPPPERCSQGTKHTNHLHLLLILRMHEAIAPPPYMCPQHAIQLNTSAILHVPLHVMVLVYSTLKVSFPTGPTLGSTVTWNKLALSGTRRSMTPAAACA